MNGNQVDNLKGSTPRPQQTPAVEPSLTAEEANDEGEGPTPIEGSGLAAEDPWRSHSTGTWKLGAVGFRR